MIGHKVMLHGCSVGNNSLIGMGAIVLNGARIGNNSLVGAGALVTEGKSFPDNSLIVGSPARAIRTLDDESDRANPPRRRPLCAALARICQRVEAGRVIPRFSRGARPRLECRRADHHAETCR